jgi:hypothetical protein
MPRYTFVRRSIVEEIFTVSAPYEHTAHDMVSDGHPAVEINTGEWVDWAEDNYHLESVEDELVTFIKGEAVNG